MKYFLLVFFLMSLTNIAFSFEGCGEYLFKGKLIEDRLALNKVKYLVNEGTQSSMSFSISEKDDFLNLSAFFNQPTEFKAKILKPMDGTIGIIKDIKEIKLRYPNPLIDVGIKKLKSIQCE
jgi:hypothetical protein